MGTRTSRNKPLVGISSRQFSQFVKLSYGQGNRARGWPLGVIRESPFYDRVRTDDRGQTCFGWFFDFRHRITRSCVESRLPFCAWYYKLQVSSKSLDADLHAYQKYICVVSYLVGRKFTPVKAHAIYNLFNWIGVE
jgi:hypothetical protein